MAALLYFDETQNVNVKPGLIFYVWCLLVCKRIFTLQSVKMCAQANEQVYIYILRFVKVKQRCKYIYYTLQFIIIFILLVYQLEHSKILIVLVFHLKHYLCIINTKLTS